VNFPHIKTLFHIIPPAFGLDISDSSLKFAQLTQTGTSLELSAYGERDIEKGVIESGVIKQPKKLEMILNETLRTKKKNHLAPYVVASLPDEEVFLKMIQVPILGQDELAGAIQLEAEANIPIGIQDAYIDFTILSLPEKKRDHYDVGKIHNNLLRKLS